jgi:hypothetical protein
LEGGGGDFVGGRVPEGGAVGEEDVGGERVGC